MVIICLTLSLSLLSSFSLPLSGSFSFLLSRRLGRSLVVTSPLALARTLSLLAFPLLSPAAGLTGRRLEPLEDRGTMDVLS